MAIRPQRRDHRGFKKWFLCEQVTKRLTCFQPPLRVDLDRWGLLNKKQTCAENKGDQRRSFQARNRAGLARPGSNNRSPSTEDHKILVE